MNDMKNTEDLKIYDKHGFYYEVTVTHAPHHGFSTSRYQGSIIASVELGRITEPHADDDREWDAYNERLSEWTDEIKSNLIPLCQNHFNK